jgi:hypothetical protein
MADDDDPAPDLQKKLVRRHGGYSAITPQVWRKWDRANADWQARRRLSANPINRPTASPAIQSSAIAMATRIRRKVPSHWFGATTSTMAPATDFSPPERGGRGRCLVCQPTKRKRSSWGAGMDRPTSIDLSIVDHVDNFLLS